MSKLAAFLFLASVVAIAAECYENIVPGVPVGRGKRVGGLWKRVPGEHSPLSPEDAAERERLLIEQEHKRAQLALGRRAVYVGLGVLIGGFVLSAALAVYLPRKLGDIIYYVGGGITLWGFAVQGAATHWKTISIIVFCLTIGGFVLHKLKWRGLFGDRKRKSAE